MQCRMCKSLNLVKYLDFGHQPPSDAFLTKEKLSEPIITYPLNVVLCKDCGLSQLGYVVDPDILYKKDYPYESSTTETGRKHYWDFADSVVKKFAFKPKSFAIDIGSNVGVLLDGFKNNGFKVLGIDPALNIVEKANQRFIETICEFFNEDVAKKVVHKYGKADVVTGTNVFAHIDNLDSVMMGVKALLKENGVFIIESPSLIELLKNNAYSSIYHEHLSYLSLTPIVRFVQKFGLQVIDIEKQNIHEGSFRVFIAKDHFPINRRVENYLKEEQDFGVCDLNILNNFATKAYKHLKQIDLLVRTLCHDSTICLLSAPAKGNTIVNSLGWNNKIISFATDKSPLKISKYLPEGTIPVLSDNALLTEKPDYSIIMAWNFQSEIIKNNQEYLSQGGRFIQLFPEIKII